MSEYTVENYITFIETGRKDKISAHGMDMIAERFRQLEAIVFVEPKDEKAKEQDDKSFTKISLTKDKRMLRFGFGKNKGKWFIRIDLWWVGFRLAQR